VIIVARSRRLGAAISRSWGIQAAPAGCGTERAPPIDPAWQHRRHRIVSSDRIDVMLDAVGFWLGIATPPIIVLLVFATLFLVQDQPSRRSDNRRVQHSRR
jgi:hypothetical protein